ncbi:uncharacterized protein LOC110986637 [Acanthaster planci]|uniref:Uncharacterized protein LOC110986637 n=1 Tax=Acanthaster planci TaxID=133434 RepID=A0A8B7ZFF1_ACAPL|nr:uncharacterized protein LOC110986637 [Acanthaster planci]
MEDHESGSEQPKSQLSSRANAFSIEALMAGSKTRTTEAISEPRQSAQNHSGYLQLVPTPISPYSRVAQQGSAQSAPSSPTPHGTVTAATLPHRPAFTLDPSRSPLDPGIQLHR